jgi:Chalcone isomerase-like
MNRALSAGGAAPALKAGTLRLFVHPTRPFMHAMFRSLLAALFACAAFAAAAASIVDQSFEDRIRLGDADLVLNGLGTRSVAVFHAYAAGLYLSQKAGSTASVLADKGPKRIQIRMMLSVDSKEFTKAINVGIARNCGEAERAALKDRVLAFGRAVDDIGKLRKGDLINLDFTPARGLVLTVNGKPRGEALPGEDLYDGVLKIFLGDLPVDKKLKAGLLGTRPQS